MSIARLRRHKDVLKRLAKAKPSVAKRLLKDASSDLLKLLSECSLNVLKGSVPLSTKQKKQLCKHKAKLRKIANKKTSQKKKRAILMRGGFLGTLLSPIIGILGSILSQ